MTADITAETWVWDDDTRTVHRAGDNATSTAAAVKAGKATVVISGGPVDVSAPEVGVKLGVLADGIAGPGKRLTTEDGIGDPDHIVADGDRVHVWVDSWV